VLAGGHDKIYPSEHAPLLERMLASGAAVSEMPFGWEARGRDFPRRNRLVSGLAQGTVVVEAARKSGSLITARFAAEQGREVFAVPGSPLDPRAEGANDLLRDGATICTSAQDVVDALARQIEPQYTLFAEGEPRDLQDESLWDELDLPDIAAAPRLPASIEAGIETPEKPPKRSAAQAPTHAEDARRRIVALLGPAPISIDELARAAAVPTGDLRAILFELALSGEIEHQPGDLISRL
jgi:DNA processing protein